MNIFEASYQRKDKVNSRIVKSGEFFTDTYESVLMGFLLKEICEIHITHYDEYMFVNNCVFVRRISANAANCIYEVVMEKPFGNHEVFKFDVFIECLSREEGSDIYKEKWKFKKYESLAEKKKKKKNEWWANEPYAIKNFLFQLSQFENLKELKKSGVLSKATYYRNLKKCQERGLIKDGKIVKRT
jgi:hypothetical protein